MEDWLFNPSSIFIYFFNYPQQKWPSHYFWLVWAVLSAADLAEKEQNWGAQGDQTCCLLHRKCVQNLVYILTFFLPSDQLLFLHKLFVCSLSFLKTSANYRWVRPCKQGGSERLGKLLPLKEQFGEQQEEVWGHASLKRGNALLALYPLPAWACKLSLCQDQYLRWTRPDLAEGKPKTHNYDQYRKAENKSPNIVQGGSAGPCLPADTALI